MTKIIFDFHRVMILSILLVLLSSCANANKPVRAYAGVERPAAEIARFQIPSALEILAVDGKKLETPYVPGSQYELEVLPGEHVLKVVYAELWGDPTTSEYVTSDAFLFKLSVGAGRTYVFKHNGPEDLVAADFTRLGDIRIWIEQLETGQTVQAENVTTYGSAVTRAILPSTYGQDVSSGVQVTAVQQTPPATVAAKQNPAQRATSALTAEQIISRQDAVDRLQFWWKLADEKQRTDFKAWIENQN